MKETISTAFRLCPLLVMSICLLPFVKHAHSSSVYHRGDTKPNPELTVHDNCPEPNYCWCPLPGSVICDKNITYIPVVPPETTDLVIKYGYLPHVNSQTFFNITNLKLHRLLIQYCEVRRLSKDAFQNLTFNTKSIMSLSYNIIPLNDLQGAICDLSNSNVTQLQLDGMHINDIPPGFFECLSYTSITDLSLKYNKLKRFSGNVFGASSKLTSLELDNNVLNSVDAIHLTNLCYFGLSYNRLENIPPFVDARDEILCPRLCTLNLTGNTWLIDVRSSDFKGLGSLAKLYMTSCRLTRIGENLLSEMPQLYRLYLQENGIQRIDTHAFNSTSLYQLDLSSNKIAFSEISNYEMFQGCANLKILYLDDNFFGYVSGPQFSKLFSPLKKLFALHLQKTSLYQFPDNLFESLPSMSALYIGSNGIAQWNSSAFSGAGNLNKLVLISNEITVINETSFPLDSLPKLKTLDIRGNPFACTCDLLWFRNWMRTTEIHLLGNYHYMCASPPEWIDKQVLQFNPTLEGCTPVNLAVVLGVSLGSVVAIVIVAIVIGIKYKLHLRYFYFLIRARMNQKYEQLECDNEYDHDAFVVYSSEDRHWVINELLPRVEIQEGYRLCVFDRDFMPGRDIVDSIMSNLESSRKVIVVLSDNFASSEWCKWELTMAQNKLLDERKEILILVKLDEIHEENLTHRLMLLMRDKVYIDWEDCNMGRDMFWQRLLSALAKPMNQYNT